MSSSWRTLASDRRRGMLVTALTVGLVGVSYGASAVSAGLPVWFPVALAMTVVAASSEFVLIAILAAGGGPISAVAAGLLLNLRHLPYGMSVKDAVGTGWRRVVSSHLINDESVVFTTAVTTPAGRRAALTVSGLAILVCWPGGALLGATAGALLASPNMLGLDAVFPAVIATLVLPKLTGRTRVAALTGAVIALATETALPAGLPILLALVGMLTLVGHPRPCRPRPQREGRRGPA